MVENWLISWSFPSGEDTTRVHFHIPHYTALWCSMNREICEKATDGSDDGEQVRWRGYCHSVDVSIRLVVLEPSPQHNWGDEQLEPGYNTVHGKLGLD